MTSSLLNDVISYVGICVCILFLLCIVVFVWRHLSCEAETTENIASVVVDDVIGDSKYEAERPTSGDEIRREITSSETYSDACLRNASGLKRQHRTDDDNVQRSSKSRLKKINLPPFSTKFPYQEEV